MKCGETLRSLLIAAGLLLTLQNAVANEEKGLAEQLKRAELALEKAAQQLAELHHKRHSKHGKHAMLGVLLGDSPMIGGVPLVGTTPKSGAAQAGLAAGDKLVEIDDLSLENADDPMAELSRYMKSVTPGVVVSVSYLRDGERQTVDVVTHARSEHIMSLLDGKEKSTLEDMDVEILQDLQVKKAMGKVEAVLSSVNLDQSKGAAPQLLAVSGALAKYFSVEDGVIITRPNKQSALLGGDVLLEIEGEAVTGIASAWKLLGAADQGDMARVLRDGAERSVALIDHELEVAMEVQVIRINKDATTP